MIVHESLKTQPGEELIIHADPTYFPALTEQVRIELVEAEGSSSLRRWLIRAAWNRCGAITGFGKIPELIDMEHRAIPYTSIG